MTVIAASSRALKFAAVADPKTVIFAIFRRLHGAEIVVKYGYGEVNCQKPESDRTLKF